MRLIDADIIKFTEYINGDITVSKQAIQNMPTSYDVDKVIEEIEDTITPTTEYRYKFCGTVEAMRCMNHESCECCIAERMIETIKSGGVSGD